MATIRHHAIGRYFLAGGALVAIAPASEQGTARRSRPEQERQPNQVTPIRTARTPGEPPAGGDTHCLS